MLQKKSHRSRVAKRDQQEDSGCRRLLADLMFRAVRPGITLRVVGAPEVSFATRLVSGVVSSSFTSDALLLSRTLTFDAKVVVHR